MGLKWISELESVFFLKKAEADDWGMVSADTVKVKYGCSIRSSESTIPIESIGGKQILPTYTISINGKIPFTVGDFVEIEGKEMIVLNKKEVKDLSRKVLYTKFTV